MENLEKNKLLCAAGINYSIYKVPQFISIGTLWDIYYYLYFLYEGNKTWGA